MDITAYHESQINQLTNVFTRQKRQSNKLLSIKIGSFLLVIFLAGWGFLQEWNTPVIALLGLTITVYVLTYIRDARLQEQIELQEALIQAHRNELRALQGEFPAFADGNEFNNPAHEYAYDLDLFGPASFFQRICRTATQIGKEKLAGTLQEICTDSNEITARQEAIRERSADNEACIRFFTRPLIPSRASHILPLIRTGEDAEECRFLSRKFHFLWSLPVILFWLTLSGMLAGWLPSEIPTLLFFLNLGLAHFLGKPAKQLYREGCSLKKEFQAYNSLLEEIENRSYTSTRLASLQEALFGKDNAGHAFRHMHKILGTLELRDNMVMYLVGEGMFLSDLLMIRLFLRWKHRYLRQLEPWLKAIAEWDALTSLANYAFNHPHFIWPQIAETPHPVIEAEALCHPFLHPAKAVGNDFKEEAREIFIVTGANMAGKSTLLRTVGISLVMASCGLPVWARKFSFLPIKLFSNMRTSDNLNQDISYFNAELLRLKQLIRYCQKQEHTFIILDEILKGTNSEDKLKGSRLFLEHITRLPVTGIVATHDLELSKIETEHSPFHNFCFEIEMADPIRYSYKMSRGVARNMNATYLLSNLLRETTAG